MITFIVGLPASGKTTLAKTIPAVLFDNRFSLSEVTYNLRNDNDVVITDPMLCIQDNRTFAHNVFKSFTQDWVYFANDPTQCKINALARGDRFVLPSIYVLSKLYNPSYVTHPVWKGN